jgi:hypothetical protein
VLFAAVSAGMAYEMCRDILGPSCIPDVQPGGSITVADLRIILRKASDAATASGQQALPLLAQPLTVMARSKLIGDWHVLPDLITMLASEWFVEDSGSSDSSQGLQAAVRNALGSALSGAGMNQATAAFRTEATNMMLLSCLRPNQPLDIREVGAIADPESLKSMCHL